MVNKMELKTVLHDVLTILEDGRDDIELESVDAAIEKIAVALGEPARFVSGDATTDFSIQYHIEMRKVKTKTGVKIGGVFLSGSNLETVSTDVRRQLEIWEEQASAGAADICGVCKGSGMTFDAMPCHGCQTDEPL